MKVTTATDSSTIVRTLSFFSPLFWSITIRSWVRRLTPTMAIKATASPFCPASRYVFTTNASDSKSANETAAPMPARACVPGV